MTRFILLLFLSMNYSAITFSSQQQKLNPDDLIELKAKCFEFTKKDRSQVAAFAVRGGLPIGYINGQGIRIVNNVLYNAMGGKLQGAAFFYKRSDAEMYLKPATDAQRVEAFAELIPHTSPNDLLAAFLASDTVVEDIEDPDDLIPKSPRKAYTEEDPSQDELAQMAQHIAKLEVHSASQTAAAPVATQAAMLSAAAIANERKAEREKRKLMRQNKAQLTQAAMATAAAPAATATPQVPTVSAEAALLEKAKKDKELAAQQAAQEANQKETERLLKVQEELRKAKGAEKQKKGKLFAPAAQGNAQDLVDQLTEANKQFVITKKFGSVGEKAALAGQYKSIAERLAKLNHEKSAEAKAKYDELQKAFKKKQK